MAEPCPLHNHGADAKAHVLEGKEIHPGDHQVAPQQPRVQVPVSGEGADHRQVLRLDEGHLTQPAPLRLVVIPRQANAGLSQDLIQELHLAPALRPYTDPLQSARRGNLVISLRRSSISHLLNSPATRSNPSLRRHRPESEPDVR